MTAHALSPAAALVRAAERLAYRARHTSDLPAVFLFTDPQRTPDPLAVVERLPPGVGVVYRAFGDPAAETVGRALKHLCRRSGRLLLVGADERLAASVGADGLHVPERNLRTVGRLRSRHPSWVITAAAHDLHPAARAARSGADAVFVSAVFPSRSPSAGRALGPLRLAVVVRLCPAPVYALGGVTHCTVNRLRSIGVAGVAAVEAFA